MRTGFLRLVGAATAVYGVAVTARPSLLARPSGLVDEQGRLSEETAASLRPQAWRDAASGLAMVLAPSGTPLATATMVRMASDFGDAVLLGRTLPRPGRRPAVVAAAIGWGALSLAGLVLRERDGGRGRRGRGAGPRRLPAPRWACGRRPTGRIRFPVMAGRRR